MTSFSKVMFLSRHNAQRLKPDGPSCVISITSPGELPVNLPQPEFDGRIHRVQCTSAQFAADGAVFTEEMGRLLADFIREMELIPDLKGSTLYVHCEHGEQRSASCALALAHYFEIDCYSNNEKQDTDNMQCSVYRIYDGVLSGLMG